MDFKFRNFNLKYFLNRLEKIQPKMDFLNDLFADVKMETGKKRKRSKKKGSSKKLDKNDSNREQDCATKDKIVKKIKREISQT